MCSNVYNYVKGFKIYEFTQNTKILIAREQSIFSLNKIYLLYSNGYNIK